MQIAVDQHIVISTECVVNDEDEAREEGNTSREMIDAFIAGYVNKGD
jgi:hypothetical protein